MKPYTVVADDAEIRLDRWVKRHLPHISHGLLEKALRKGWVKLDKKKATASTRVVEGQIIEFADYMFTQNENAPPLRVKEHSISLDDIKMIKKSVIYEDAELIAINKPAGLAVQGGSKQNISVDVLAQHLVKEGETVPKLVHRLDKDTSGVLLLAKTSKSAAELARLFANQEVEKVYTALVIGVPKPRKGRIDMPLVKTVRGKNSTMEKVDIDFEDGKDAITEYEVISNAGQRYAWVALYPRTGRMHQLRVHMASIEHPIVGDGKYGGAEAFIRGGGIDEQLHLHAAKITLERRGKKTLIIEAPLSAHMQNSKDLIG